MTLGNNPSVSLGPPVCLDYTLAHDEEQQQQHTLSIDEYESIRNGKRRKPNHYRMKISKVERLQILKQAGFSQKEIQSVERLSIAINDLLDCASIHSIDFSLDGHEQQKLLPPVSPSWLSPHVSQERHLTEQVAAFLPQNQSETICTMEKYKVHLDRLNECINQSKRPRAQVSVVKEHMKKRAKKNILAAMGIRSELTEGSRKKLMLQSRVDKSYNNASDASASTSNDNRRVSISSNFSSNLSKGY